ncbi:MAG: hypothetical protein F4X92_04465 [Gammaproteobacteria bacterium]|nr:hypothetical protein [Gammaproteobacteria bacterium]
MIEPHNKQSLFRRAFGLLLGRIRPSGKPARSPDSRDLTTLNINDALASQINLIEKSLANRHAASIDQKQLKSIIEGYLDLGQSDQRLWMQVLVSQFDIDEETLHDRMLEYLSTHRRDLLKQIRRLMRSPWEKLLQHIQQTPAGLEFLIRLRSGLLSFDNHPDDLDNLESVLHELLAQEFHPKSLSIRELGVSGQPDLIEMLVDYQALHQTHTSQQLQNRLEGNHHCFALFHSDLIDTPLVFVLVARVSEIPDNIHDLYDDHLSATESEGKDNAIIYSISNVASGLEDLGLESLLVDRLLSNLDSYFGELENCLALAPLPGFRDYVKALLSSPESTVKMTREEVDELNELFKIGSRESEHEILESSKLFQHLLTRLCVGYLINEKNGHKAMNTIADFHLSNGATIDRIHWLGDHLNPGMHQSFGIMVRYQYKIREYEENRLRYLSDHEIRYSAGIRELIQ